MYSIVDDKKKDLSEMGRQKVEKKQNNKKEWKGGKKETKKKRTSTVRI